MLKKILFAIVALMLFAVVILPALLPSEYDVQRSIVIKKDREDIYSRLVNFETWQEWSPWYEQEPEAEYEFGGVPGVVGSYSAWKGKVIGSGQQTLVKVTSPEYIQTELKFTEPNQDTATGYWKLNETPEGTEVIWGMKGSLPYPIGRLMGTYIKSMISKDFDKGLQKLKEISEQ